MIFNYVVAVLFPALYIVLCIVLVFRTKGASSSNVAISKVQKQVIIKNIVVYNYYLFLDYDTSYCGLSLFSPYLSSLYVDAIYSRTHGDYYCVSIYVAG